MQRFNSVDELINTIKPIDPVYCIRPNSIKSACSWFKDKFHGKILYAVKTNPNEKVIRYIGEAGISRFDVASINEIKLIKKVFPKAHTYYMNSIKSRDHIRDAYFNYISYFSYSFSIRNRMHALRANMKTQTNLFCVSFS